jgi:hypothetical protein
MGGSVVGVEEQGQQQTQIPFGNDKPKGQRQQQRQQQLQKQILRFAKDDKF